MADDSNNTKRVYTDEERKERAAIRRLIRQGKVPRYSLARDEKTGLLERERTKVTIYHKNGLKSGKQRPRLTLRQIAALK